MIKNKLSETPSPAAGNPKGSLPELRLMTGEQGRVYGVGMIENKITLTPAVPNSPSVPQMEWGRWRDVQHAYGVKRGLLHLLVAEGKIKSCLIRRRGNVHGTRYYYMESISAYLHTLMEEQTGGARE